TREYQTDQSSPILLRLLLALSSEKQKQKQEQPHTRAGIDRVTPYQSKIRGEHPLHDAVR
ncbi:MAG: hypothetical protein ACP5E5_11285, partial [Acidobacteriaceae bacterium]